MISNKNHLLYICWYWPGTKTILTQYKSDTDPVQKWYWPGTKAIPFLVPLHNVFVPAVPEHVTSPVLVYGTGTCTGTVCKTCIERYLIGTLHRIQRYRTGTTYHHWTEPERVPNNTGMFTGMLGYAIMGGPNGWFDQTAWGTWAIIEGANFFFINR